MRWAATGLVLVGLRAGAQALPTAKGPGTYVAVGGGVSVFESDYGKRLLGGGLVYADVHPTWRYGMEAEVRWLDKHTDEGVTETNYLLGPRVAILPGRLRPYAKFLIGDSHIRFPFGYATGDYLTYAPGGGVELKLGDRFAARLVDFEYQFRPQFSYGELKPYGVSAGLSFRLNGHARRPHFR